MRRKEFLSLMMLMTLVFQMVAIGASKERVHVFASFRGNGQDGLHLAYSRDGLEWKALMGDRSFLKPQVGGKLMRDPCIIQGPDGLFHMVWTTGWWDKTIGIAHSKDLITWSEQKVIGVMEHEPKAKNCWAPEITWDPDGQQYVIYWATSIPGKFTETLKRAGGGNHRMYYTTTKDFKTYTKSQVFYEPGFSVIDSTIIHNGDHYVMIFKNESGNPAEKNLRIAVSDKVTGPWSKGAKPFSPKGLWVEGPTCTKVGDYWYVYYDVYRKHRYGALKTKDFKNWEDISSEIRYPKGLRHGTIFTISEKHFNDLQEYKGPPPVKEPLQNGSFEITTKGNPRDWSPVTWRGKSEQKFALNQGRSDSGCVLIKSASGADAAWSTQVAVSPQSRYRLSGWIQTQNVVPGSGHGALLNIHNLSHVKTTAVTATTKWKKVQVDFETNDESEITINALLGGWGTSTGTAWYDDIHVEYLGEKKQPALNWPTPSVNPVIPDCAADPSISEFDGVYYLTATTDDCPRPSLGHWQNGPAVVWKSTDLVNWSFQGHAMPETNDKLYWAPSRIIKRDDTYLLYPTIDKKIRVAAASSPEGPFRLIAGTDKTPLLNTIDAEVYVDDDGKGYLFSNHRKVWRMNDDFTAVSGDPISIPTQRKGYSEGPIMFKRKGIYYYLYTLGAHESYHYAYCMSRTSPLGPFETPVVDVIAKSNAVSGIHGPGHGTVFSPSDSENYYFVYLEYGRGGVTRQISIDQLKFNEDGTIQPVKLTTTGIQPLINANAKHETVTGINLATKKEVIVSASSSRASVSVYGRRDRKRLIRKQDHLPTCAVDQSNFTRWQPEEQDKASWLMVDLGKPYTVQRSELSLYRPTLGHAYRLEISMDGKSWKTITQQKERQIKSPQTDDFDVRARYWRLSIQAGHQGVWEWKLIGDQSP